MVSFLKGCSTEIVEDGGHQEGEVQAGCDEGRNFAAWAFFMCFERECSDNKGFDVAAGWTSVTWKMYIFNGVGDYLQAKISRKISGSIAWLFPGSSDLITEEVIQHNIWEGDKILSLTMIW